MKITLEFDRIENFFSQLPRFAALMNFSGQFAKITTKPKADTEVTLEEPDLPIIEQEPGTVRIHGTKTETAEEAGKKIEAAYDAAAATEVAAGPAKDQEPTEEAEVPEGPTAAPAKAAKTGRGKKSTEKPTPTEKPAERPQTAADDEVKDTDVRRALNRLIKSGKRDSVVSILEAFGAENFTGLKASDYAAALKKAKEVLGNDGE